MQSIEYRKRVLELELIAKILIMEKSPIDARQFAKTLNQEDAYILGCHIGGLMESGFHQTGVDIRGIKTAIEFHTVIRESRLN